MNALSTNTNNGWIAWFAHNPVAANLLFFAMLALGIYAALFKLNFEVLPSIELATVDVTIPYPGATPREVEQSITSKAEDALVEIIGIDEIRSTSSEGAARITLDVAPGFDAQKITNEVRSALDRITTFPEDAEESNVNTILIQRSALEVVLYGEVDDVFLRRLAEETRDKILALPEVTLASISPRRPFEIGIQIDRATLETYGLKWPILAEQLANNSVNISSGKLKSNSSEILLRTDQQALSGKDFARLPISGQSDGRQLLLGDIATITDGFDEDRVRVRYAGLPAIKIRINSNDQQDVIEIARKVKDFVANAQADMPAGVSINYLNDRSRFIQSRLDTLLKNGTQGAILVFLVLALFIRLDVAFWVAIGVPASFASAITLLPQLGVTINMISAFSFILVLGVVVDDAIVTGENIFHRFKQGHTGVQATIDATHEIAKPVTFGVLTTVASFIPLLLLSGPRGEMFKTIPMVVIPVLLFSLVESKLVLPAHLRHLEVKKGGVWGKIDALQQALYQGLDYLIRVIYQPVLQILIAWRYATLAAFLSAIALTIALAFTGWIKFSFFPTLESESARALLTMPFGTSWEKTDEYIQRIDQVAQTLQKKYSNEQGESVIRSIISGSGTTSRGTLGSHLGYVNMEIKPPEQRGSLNVGTRDIIKEWRQAVGDLPGVDQLDYKGNIFSSRPPVKVEITGNDDAEIGRMVQEIRQHLQNYPDLYGIADNFNNGKQEISIALKPQASLIPLSVQNVASQIRQSVYGKKILTLQRGREEVEVVLRLNRQDRNSLSDLLALPIYLPNGQTTALAEVAELSYGRSPASIKRRQRQRSVEVWADADKVTANLSSIQTAIREWLPTLNERYNGTVASAEGEAREQQDMFTEIKTGLALAAFLIYLLLAIPLKSYALPLIIMSVIPAGFACAILGHIILGRDLSIISVIGMLALSGVVINDSLLLVSYIKTLRAQKMPLIEAAVAAGVRRMRPVLITSLTTFVGLVPLIFEKSTQAQFLIPMAISLGVGILLATFVTLFFIPVLVLIGQDMRNWWNLGRHDPQANAPTPTSGSTLSI